MPREILGLGHDVARGLGTAAGALTLRGHGSPPDDE